MYKVPSSLYSPNKQQSQIDGQKNQNQEDQEATSTMNTNDSSHAPVSNLSSESGYSNNSDGTTINFNDFDHQYQDQQYLDGQTVEVGNTQSFDAGTLITMRKNDKIYRKTEKLEEEKMFSSSSKNTSTKQNYDEDSREYNQLILGVQSGLSQSNNNNNLYNEEQQSVQENIEIPIQQITVLDQEYLGEVYNFGQGQENSAFYAPHSPQINQRRRSEDQFLIDLINMLGVDFSFKDGRKRKSKLKADLIRDVLNLVNKDFTFQNLNTFLSSNNNNQNNQQYLKYQRINQILNELNIESHSVCRRNLLQAFTALYSEKKSTVKLYNNYKNVRFLFKDANENQKGLQLIKETLNNQYSDSYCSMLHEVCQQAYCVWFTEFTEREFIPYLQLNYKRIAYPLGQREERVFMTKCVEYYYDKLFLSNIL